MVPEVCAFCGRHIRVLRGVVWVHMNGKAHCDTIQWATPERRN